MKFVFTIVCVAFTTRLALAEPSVLPVPVEACQTAFGGRAGTFIVIDCATKAVSTFRAEFATSKLPPCSTFKIWNTLIGLECGMISSADQPFYTWDGEKRVIADWNRNLTLKEAFQVSCVPAFQELARTIGARKMRMWIDRIGYGDRNTAAGVDVFWLPAPGRRTLLISPEEQARLMCRLALGQVPFSSQSQSVLREIMTVRQTDKGVLCGKTGSSGAGTDENPAVGWFVGYVDARGERYAFACAVRGKDASGKAAKEIVETVVERQGLL